MLVDRLWPRGITKADAPIDEWVKEVAPSTDLRRWYDHRVARFDEFVRRYRVELTQQFARDAVDRLRTVARSNGLILVTATRDVEHSGAEVLRRVLNDPAPGLMDARWR